MKADWATAATDRATTQGGDRGLWAGSGWVRVCVWLLLVTGLAARLSPLLDVEGRLYWLWMSEDGYLMQTIARNMAIGLGMSTAHGTMPTNGVQPLATFLYAGLHALAGGSKLLAIGYVTVFATAVSAAAAWVFWRLGRSVLRDLPFARDIALLAAALWFASPLVVGHSMNGLETGLYYLAITITLLYYFSLDLSAAAPMRAGQRVALGLLLGVTFLARNDAVFFIAAVLAAHLLLGGASAGGGWGRRAGDAVVAGGLSMVVASPWLAYNKLMFGSVVPISGLAESHSAGFGANLRMIPATLLEASLLYVRIPRVLETAWPVIVVAVAVLAGLAWAAWSLVGRRSLRGLRFCVITLVFCAGVGSPMRARRKPAPLCQRDSGIFSSARITASTTSRGRSWQRSPRGVGGSTICRETTTLGGPRNGGSPESISYVTTPRAYRSLRLSPIRRLSSALSRSRARPKRCRELACGRSGGIFDLA